MKYKVKSADVLNEADRFQRILDWQLFCMEQETQLWGYNPQVEWIPGTPVHEHPRYRNVFDNPEWDQFEDFDDEGVLGNCIRPIVQTHEYYEDDEDDDGFIGNRYERIRSYPYVKCEPCGVSWGPEEDTCWMCGTFYERPKGMRRFFSPVGDRQYEFGVDHGVLYIPTMPRQEDVVARMVDMRVDIHGITAQFQLVGQAAEDALRVMRGMYASFSFYDEAMMPEHFGLRSMQWGAEAFSIQRYEPPTPPPNPFEREEREIELVRPVAANLWESVRGSVHIPADVDLSGRSEPPMPQVPEPRDFSQDQDRIYWERMNPNYYRRDR